MKLSTAFFVLSILSISVISCDTTPSKKDDKKSDAAAASSNAVRYQLITNAIKSPVQMVTAPDNTNRLFISDLGGKIFIMQNGKLLPKPFIDVSSKLEQKDTTAAMRAIFSMAFHPDFAANKKFYICYNAPASDTADKCKLMISEFRASNTNADIADASTERKVLEVDGSTIGVDGCQIAFGPDGYLYIAIGDNGTPLEKREAQDLHSYLGKLLRIDVNKTPYAIPSDNPFITNKNAKPEIWSYGLRRLWRFSFDPDTHLLFGADIGDKTEEEIDIIQKGGNYGWPIKEADSLAVTNTTADTSGFIPPVNSYSHKDGICVIGGSVYHGDQLPFLKNKYVFADFNGSLFAIGKNENEKWLRNPIKVLNPPTYPFTIFSFDKDTNNELYVLGVLNTKAGSIGAVYKLVHI
ncbi:PQQ-dependent sugar dehydrogenase [Segetibacter koreensis]|uniref:PQQ-dependent sugar dehydrogenase n=1 Tax=Segetibacter koreensis TaxID=398037 RepID=UPI00035CA2EE|nr:PQQ-dependent sugar dehydrogenase [Segetibacter koreensis]